jgi:hypothetical protein
MCCTCKTVLISPLLSERVGMNRTASWFTVREAEAKQQLRNFMRTITAAFSPIQTLQRLSELKTSDCLSNEKRRFLFTLPSLFF